VPLSANTELTFISFPVAGRFSLKNNLHDDGGRELTLLPEKPNPKCNILVQFEMNPFLYKCERFVLFAFFLFFKEKKKERR